jgi:hypothetical protein
MFPTCSKVIYFPISKRTTDEEVVAAFRIAIERREQPPRLAEIYLNTVAAEHLLKELRDQGLDAVRRTW